MSAARRSGLGLALALLALGPAGAADLQPFAVDHFRRADSDADLRFLTEGPAGSHGFVRAEGGHLVTADGRRLRLWGVNDAGFTPGSALLPPHADAEVYAAELERLGVNAVRFQFLDLSKEQQPGTTSGPMTSTPSGLIAAGRNDSRELDPGQLDRLDFLVARLKAHGVYIDLNLNVGRRYLPGDGVPDAELIGPAKAMTYFEPRLIELQKEYARELLTHVNPYTRTDYAHEPAVAIVEILNENSVLEFWQRNWFRGELVPGAPRHQLDLPPHYKALLTRLYNDWLARTRPPAEVARLRTLAGVGPDREVPILQRQEFDEAPAERFYAEGEFYAQLEGDFLTGFEAYLKRDLGVRSLVIGTNDHTYWIPGMPLLRSTSRLDVIDAHGYWQHPAISGRRNTPMVNDPEHSLMVKLTRSAMAGRPFTSSEVNEPFPSDYECELIPLLAAYGGFQDWDGIFLYAMEPKLAGSAKPAIGDHFDLAQDPVKIAQLPAGALLFRRADVSPARRVVERTYSRREIDESMRLPESEDPYFTPGFPLQLPLVHGSRILALDAGPTAPFSLPPADPIVSDTGQLAWHTSEREGGLVTIDTERSSALVGFVKGWGLGTSRLSAEIANRFCALTLSSLDARPISRAALLLLTATGRTENTGQVWNARRTMTDPWGGPPTRIEPIRGWVLLKQLEGAVDLEVTPLDGASRPLAAQAARHLEAGWEFQIGQQPATSYLLRVIR